MTVFAQVLGQALMITGFVFIMMLVIEYLNVLTRGNWNRVVARWRWGQSFFTSLLGATPGCLGTFAVASLYMHRVVTFGGLVAAMIATCGDEAFVMLALFPGRALVIFGLLCITGAVSGIVVDAVLKSRRTRPTAELAQYQPTHADAEECVPFSRRALVDQWRRCTPHRGWLTLFLALFLAGVVSGRFGHQHLGVETHKHAHAEQAEHAVEGPEAEEEGHGEEAGHGQQAWNWVRITLLVLGLVGLAIVASVPDHFLDEHLWNHIARVHIWRIFAWTLGALLVTRVLVGHIHLESAVEAHRLPILLLACLVGIIPESGPHLIFVTLYAAGTIPFSILLASCVVQDGHGMIPILAHSRRAFLAVKAVNFAVGLAVGLAGHGMGW